MKAVPDTEPAGPDTQTLATLLFVTQGSLYSMVWSIKFSLFYTKIWHAI